MLGRKVIDWVARKRDRDSVRAYRERREAAGATDDFDAMERETLDNREYTRFKWLELKERRRKSLLSSNGA